VRSTHLVVVLIVVVCLALGALVLVERRVVVLLVEVLLRVVARVLGLVVRGLALVVLDVVLLGVLLEAREGARERAVVVVGGVRRDEARGDGRAVVEALVGLWRGRHGAEGAREPCKREGWSGRGRDEVEGGRGRDEERAITKLGILNTKWRLFSPLWLSAALFRRI